MLSDQEHNLLSQIGRSTDIWLDSERGSDEVTMSHFGFISWAPKQQIKFHFALIISFEYCSPELLLLLCWLY